jgi:hypothetical protein
VNRWEDYRAAAVQLDEVRREAAAAVAAQQAAAEAAAAELAGVRQRIVLQRIRLTEVATRVARSVPLIEPQETERSAAAAMVASVTSDPTPGINAALQGARATLDAADATLSVAADTPAGGILSSRSPAVRNGLVYGWYAVLALIALVEINAIAGASPQANLILVLFALLVPAGSWLLGWTSVKLLFGKATKDFGGTAIGLPGAAPETGLTAVLTSPSGAVLGALICGVPLAVGVALSVV